MSSKAALCFPLMKFQPDFENYFANSALEALCKGSDEDKVSMTDFRPFCQTHQALMAPVFAVQDKLKKTTMGTNFWENIASRRVEVRRGYNVPLSDLMVLVSLLFCMCSSVFEG